VPHHHCEGVLHSGKQHHKTLLRSSVPSARHSHGSLMLSTASAAHFIIFGLMRISQLQKLALFPVGLNECSSDAIARVGILVSSISSTLDACGHPSVQWPLGTARVGAPAPGGPIGRFLQRVANHPSAVENNPTFGQLSTLTNSFHGLLPDFKLRIKVGSPFHIWTVVSLQEVYSRDGGKMSLLSRACIALALSRT